MLRPWIVVSLRNPQKKEKNKRTKVKVMKEEEDDDKNKPEVIPDELEREYSYGGVPNKLEIAAAFFGQEDEMILTYLRSVPNPRGAILAHLILYFVHEYGFMSKNHLMKKLKSLIKYGYIVRREEAGLKFYKAVKEV